MQAMNNITDRLRERVRILMRAVEIVLVRMLEIVRARVLDDRIMG
jgi:hypothetical protein